MYYFFYSTLDFLTRLPDNFIDFHPDIQELSKIRVTCLQSLFLNTYSR